MNHIVIIGFMGSGKTRVGKRLAKDFNLPFVDVDRVVSKKMNLTMKEIFDRFGEPFYRALETTVIKALIDDPEQKIISLGSGLPMQEQNAKYFWVFLINPCVAITRVFILSSLSQKARSLYLVLL